MCTPCCPKNPVPENHADLIGNWSGTGTTLTLVGDGSIQYQTPNTSVNAGVSKWDDSGFKVVMCMCCGPSFQIQEKPHQDEDGNWKVTINNIQMTKE